MSTTTVVETALPADEVQHKQHRERSRFDSRPSPITIALFLMLLGGGVVFMIYSVYTDVAGTGTGFPGYLAFLLLGLALLIALGFEFVNGFHDTANAVATVIYTNSLHPNIAVMWSGLWNFLGVLLSSGAVAFGIVSLLPVELILQVGSKAGFAMVFALLIAAIVWNLGTWYIGLPASSSHTLIGSIIGVGLANQLMATSGSATSGVDWAQAANVGKALLFSPVIGFVAAGLLLLAAKVLIRNKALYEEPQGNKPPPLWIRSILILTCTGVSFAHGSNDGQKGMGLIMLILIGTVPTAYALDRAVPDSYVPQFQQATQAVQTALQPLTAGIPVPIDAKAEVQQYVASHRLAPDTVAALSVMTAAIEQQIVGYGQLNKLPADATTNVRNEMYLASETIRLMLKAGNPVFDVAQLAVLKEYRDELDEATKFIPLWVKIVVAIALGLGTMVGWKRIVITVGEKIGKTHLTYAQGASAELVAMATIGAADVYGLPVSTTHVLSSGIAGTMAANGSGLRLATIRNIAMAWVLTLPAAIMLAGGLYWLLVQAL
jgi:PiT family inorganic phosphate transporter